MKSIIFWDVTPCSLLRLNQRFGGTYRLHLQGRRISLARNQRESRWQAELCLTLNGLRGVISQKIVLFITTAVRTSHPTNYQPYDKVSLSDPTIFPFRIIFCYSLQSLFLSSLHVVNPLKPSGYYMYHPR
jgi:hypothetical protein